MPKKKKNGQSPSRGTRQGAEYGSGLESRAHGTNGSVVTQADSSSWGYSNFGSTLQSGGQSGSQSRDKVIQGMQEMFSHLDPEVIYMVLSEADFKGRVSPVFFYQILHRGHVSYNVQINVIGRT